MTVIEGSKRGNVYWHEAFEEVKGTGPAKVLALLYLAVTGEDYAYNMVNQFRKMPLNVKTLKDQSQIQPILKDLKERGFLISRTEKVNGRKLKWFSINPLILCTPNDSKNYALPGKNSLDITENEIRDFFNQLKEKYQDKKDFIKQWDLNGNPERHVMRGTKKYDYITFILAMQEEASDLNLSNLTQQLETYVAEIQRVERESRRIRELHHGISAHILPPSARIPS